MYHVDVGNSYILISEYGKIYTHMGTSILKYGAPFRVTILILESSMSYRWFLLIISLTINQTCHTSG